MRCPVLHRPIPGALKNAIGWESRPWGQHSFDHMPAAVIGASPCQIGTALAQQSLRRAEFLQRPTDDRPRCLHHPHPGLITDGEVADESTAAFLADFMQEFRVHTERVLTVLPRT